MPFLFHPPTINTLHTGTVLANANNMPILLESDPPVALPPMGHSRWDKVRLPHLYILPIFTYINTQFNNSI